MNRCDFYLENLSSYLDRELSEDEMKNIEEHLKECNSCAIEFDLLKTIVSTCSELEEELPDGFSSSLHTRLEKAREDMLAKRNKTRSIKLFSQIAAAFLLVITLGISMRLGLFDNRYSTKNSTASDPAPMAAGQDAPEVNLKMKSFGVMGSKMAEGVEEVDDAGSGSLSSQSIQSDALDNASNKKDSEVIYFSEAVTGLSDAEDYTTQVTIVVDDIGKAIESIMAIDEKLGKSRETNMAYLENSFCAYRGTRNDTVELKLIYASENEQQSFLTEMQSAFTNIQVEWVSSEEQQEYIRVIIEKKK